MQFVEVFHKVYFILGRIARNLYRGTAEQSTKALILMKKL
jgi:hypothetical protein